MPSSNLPDPDKIPDMSLGERTDKASPSVPADVASSYQPQPDQPKPAPVPAPAETPTTWRVGDDVMAPWEPMFLYAGTIKQILVDEARGDQALIDFDDGGEGWVFLYSLVPLDYQPGQKLQCRRGNGPTFEPAEVLELNDGDIRVRFESGGSEWTSFATLRIPCIENGPGASPTKFAPFQPPPAAPSTGIPSWAIWIGISILLAFVRIACREMARN